MAGVASKADLITGPVLTVDDTRPTAEAPAVADGRIIGNRSDVDVRATFLARRQVHRQ